MLPVFTCVGAIGNLWSICLGVNILSRERSDTFAALANMPRRPFLSICSPVGNILLSKPSTTLRLSSRSLNTFWKASVFCRFSGIFDFVDSLNLSVLSLNFICSSSASFNVKMPLQISLPKDLAVLYFWKQYVLLHFCYLFYELNNLYWFLALFIY